MNGTGLIESVFFLAEHYNVTLNEEGLPVGTLWSITEGQSFPKGVLRQSTNVSITYSEPVGNYTFFFYNDDAPSFSQCPSPEQGPCITDPSYTENTSRLEVAVTSSNVSRSVGFSLSCYVNSTKDPQPPIGNSSNWFVPLEIGPLVPVTIEYDFIGELVGGVPQNNTAYVLTSVEFQDLLATGNITSYVLATPNEGQGAFNVSFDPGANWYIVLYGPNAAGHAISWIVVAE